MTLAVSPASFSNQNDLIMPCFEMVTQAVHFTECNAMVSEDTCHTEEKCVRVTDSFTCRLQITSVSSAQRLTFRTRDVKIQLSSKGYKITLISIVIMSASEKCNIFYFLVKAINHEHING